MSTTPLRGLERVIGALFRWGVACSAAALLAGLVATGIGSTLGRPLLVVGLVVMMSVPALRVLLSAGDAIRRRDLVLSVATLAVVLELVWLFARQR
jgi:uncharacterized membrane protein